MKAAKYVITIVSVLLLCLMPARAAEFSDVPAGSVTADAVAFLHSLDVVQGRGNGTFCPNDLVSRAEFAVMLCKLTGAETTNPAPVMFPDVENHWAKQFIAAALENGYMNGYGDLRFHPNDTLTFEQAVTVAMKILYPDEDFHTQGAWYQGYMDKAFAGGYTQGMYTNISLPLSRGDLAILLYRISTHFHGDAYSFSYENQNTGYVYRDFKLKENQPYTICITSETMGNEHLRQIAAAEPNTRYIISADIKTADVKASNADSRVEGACISAQEKGSTWNVSANLQGTNDWMTARTIGLSDAEGKLSFDLNLGGSNTQMSSGTAWFRNISYTKASDDQNTDATWKFLAVILPNTSLDTKDDTVKGGELHLSHTMQQNHIKLIEDAVEKLEDDFTALSGGKINAQIDVMVSEAVMSAYEKGDVGYAIPAEAAYTYCKENGIDTTQYDHIYFISSLPNMPTDYFGLGGSYIDGYTGFSQIYFHSDEYLASILGGGQYWTSSVFIHEFLHSMENYSALFGYSAAVLHDGAKYGYQEHPGDWKEFYTDFLNQQIVYQGEKIGVDPQIWKIRPRDFKLRPAK